MPNKLIPEKKVRTSEKVLRYVKRVDKFTVKSLSRAIRVRRETVRYHVARLEDNLLIEPISAVQNSSTPIEYRYVDRVGDLNKYMEESYQSAHYYKALYDLSLSLRKGENPDAMETLNYLKDGIEGMIGHMEQDLRLLKDMHKCKDLWNKRTLVNRMFFRS